MRPLVLKSFNLEAYAMAKKYSESVIKHNPQLKKQVDGKKVIVKKAEPAKDK